MVVVLYHANCQDGLFAAYVTWLQYGDKAVYIPVNYKPIQDITPEEAVKYIFKKASTDYGNMNPTSSYKAELFSETDYPFIDLIVVDYCFPASHIDYLSKTFRSMLIVDHHATAFKDIQSKYASSFRDSTTELGVKIAQIHGNVFMVFSEVDSGAKATFKHLNKDQPVPSYIELVSDRDLWKFDLKLSKVFHDGIELLALPTFAAIRDYIDNNMAKLVEVGTMFKKYKDRQLEGFKKSGAVPVTITINGTLHKAVIINQNPKFASDLCDLLLQDEEPQIAICYCILKYDDKVLLSIRSKQGVDSSLISLYYGGGGHARSNSCSITLEVLLNLLRTKSLEITYE